MKPKRDAERIVVGVNGSSASRAAARWAIYHARSGDTVELIHAWSPAASVSPSGGIPDYLREAELVTRHELEHLRSLPRDDGVGLIGRAIRGLVVDVLSTLGADVIVIGTDSPVVHGRANMASVPARLVRMSRKPVVVVPFVGTLA